MRDIPTVKFALASNFFEANVVFGAPEHLTAFGAAHFSP
jgi:hypothetical protein